MVVIKRGRERGRRRERWRRKERDGRKREGGEGKIVAEVNGVFPQINFQTMNLLHSNW